MDKKQQVEKRNNFLLLFAGLLLVIGLLIIYREGLTWFTATKWSHISVVSWINIVLLFSFALVLQYYFLMLLRYSFIKYLVLWFIPVIWLFNNGLVAMHRFFDWTTDIVSPAGWIPLGEFVGWMLSAVFFPVLVGSGAFIAIIDSNGSMLTQACYYASIAMDITGVSGWNIFSYLTNFINIIWDLLSHSFVQEVIKERATNRSFLDFSLSSIFNLPYWVLSVGYSFTCIVL
ncbi:MAG: hypothetical protein HND53_14655 [Proteobacteria bacterium]|nr:hypothetical protein [Pseudomonadota bacterium]NOG61729.1 hypothetical protein [Pseudomonadota bacterium]